MKNLIYCSLLFLLLKPVVLRAQDFQSVPDSLTACNGMAPSFFEGGTDKSKKLQNKVLSHAGIYDTADISIYVSTVIIHHYREGDTIPEGAELIPLGKYSVLCYKGAPIFSTNHLLSKCFDINKVLAWYGYGAGIYYIQFKKGGKDIDTSYLKYATPLGKKADMHLQYAD